MSHLLRNISIKYNLPLEVEEEIKNLFLTKSFNEMVLYYGEFSDMWKYFEKRTYPDELLRLASFYGNFPLVLRAIELKSDDFNTGLIYAAEGGHFDLIEFFIEKIKSKKYFNRVNWNYGMYGSALGGHLHLVEFFIKGADADIEMDWEYGMYNAAEGGHLDIIKLFISKGAKHWDRGMTNAARGGHLDIVKFFIEKGATSFYLTKNTAKIHGHSHIIQYLDTHF